MNSSDYVRVNSSDDKELQDLVNDAKLQAEERGMSLNDFIILTVSLAFERVTKASLT